MQDVTEQVAKRAEKRDRIAELARRDREHGGLIPADRDREAKERSMRAWIAPYSPSATRSEIEHASDPLPDFRTITVGRLAHDVAIGVKRWSSWRREDARVIEQDALSILLRWSEHGSDPSERYPHAERIDLGGKLAESMARRVASMEPTPAHRALRAIRELERVERTGSLPMRRDWIDPIKRDRDGVPMPTRGALRAIRAAIRQATADLDASARKLPETPSGDTLDVAELVAAEKRSHVSAMPEDIDAPEQVAAMMECPLDAARALIARGYPRSLDELAESWRLTPSALNVALSRGKRWLRERYPDPADLLDAIDALAEQIRARREMEATLALVAWRESEIDALAALEQVERWRGTCRALDDARRAELAAARIALRRSGAGYGSERAERIALSARRIIGAEQNRKRRNGRLRQTGELATTYPHVERTRCPMPARELAAVAAKRAELATLLEAGSGDADRIRRLRSELAGIGR